MIIELDFDRLLSRRPLRYLLRLVYEFSNLLVVPTRLLDLRPSLSSFRLVLVDFPARFNEL